MIFNVESTMDIINDDSIKPSQYEVGLEGALMYVYETECNYNELMKAVGLSELKYYREMGGDLLLNEAGAFKGFIDKVKGIFETIIRKIKEMFKKFAMVISSHISEDKKFLKKYKDFILDKQSKIKDFSFKGYEFKNTVTKIYSFRCNDVSSIYENVLNGSVSLESKDDINKYVSDKRGASFKSNDSLSFNDFKTKFKNYLYGEKKELTNIDLNEMINRISVSKNDIDAANKIQKEITDNISKFIKSVKESKDDDEVAKINTAVKVAKDISQTYTAAYGIITAALKDRNRQAKAICIKAVSYANKNATKNESSFIDDLFSNVII